MAEEGGEEGGKTKGESERPSLRRRLPFIAASARGTQGRQGQRAGRREARGGRSSSDGRSCSERRPPFVGERRPPGATAPSVARRRRPPSLPHSLETTRIDARGRRLCGQQHALPSPEMRARAEGRTAKANHRPQRRGRANTPPRRPSLLSSQQKGQLTSPCAPGPWPGRRAPTCTTTSCCRRRSCCCRPLLQPRGPRLGPSVEGAGVGGGAGARPGGRAAAAAAGSGDGSGGCWARSERRGGWLAGRTMSSR